MIFTTFCNEVVELENGGDLEWDFEVSTVLGNDGKQHVDNNALIEIYVGY